MSEQNGTPAWGYTLLYYANLGTSDAPEWVQFTELLSMEMASDANTYEPDYLERKSSPKYVKSRSYTINYEKDTMIGGKFDDFVLKNRNKTDIPLEVVRAFSWLGTPEAMTADKAVFNFTANAPHNNNAGQPVLNSGTFNMSDEDWTEGLWNNSENSKGFIASGGETEEDGEEANG